VSEKGRGEDHSACMGQSWSEPPVSDRAPAALERLSRFERLSLSTHLGAIKAGKTTLPVLLGIQHLTGGPVLLRIADALAAHDLESNIADAVCWLSDRHPSIESWPKMVFDAASAASLGPEKIMAYDDVLCLFQALLSAYDWDPADFSRTAIEPVDLAVVGQMLQGFRSPAVRFDAFAAACSAYPYVLPLLKTIWRRLLVDGQTTHGGNQGSPQVLNRNERAVLFAKWGSSVLDTTSLFRSGLDGLSISRFGTILGEAEHSTLVLLRGRCSATLNKNWPSKHHKVDRVLEPVDGAPPHVGPIAVGIVVGRPWQRKGGICCGNSQILVWEPFVHISDGHSVFCDPALGLGAGFVRPSTFAYTHKDDVSLAVENSLQYGVLQIRSAKRDFRFYLDEVAILECNLHEVNNRS